MHFGALPAYKDAMEQQVFKDYIETNIAIKALYQQKDAVNWLNSINGSAGVRTAIDKMISEAFFNNVEPLKAYNDMIASANNELNQ